MSTKKETTTTAQYDPASMNAFTAFQPTIKSGLMDYVNNPGKLQNLWLQQAYKQLGLSANRMNSNAISNLTAGGWGGGNLPAFLQATLSRNARANSAMRGNAFLQTLFQTDANKKWALGNMMGYQPLQTGQTSVEKTGGLGTWLPQMISAGIGAATAFGTGGASLMAGGAGGAGSLFSGGLSPSIASSLSGMGFNTVSKAPNPFMGSNFWKG